MEAHGHHQAGLALADQAHGDVGARRKHGAQHAEHHAHHARVAPRLHPAAATQQCHDEGRLRDAYHAH